MRTRWLILIPAGLLLCALFALMARGAQQAEQDSLDHLQDRFRLRVEIGEPFLRSYVRDIQQRERVIAGAELSAVTVSDASLQLISRGLGFEAAVIVAGDGKLMNVFPRRPEILGTDVAKRYEHLRTALSQGSAVSSVTASAAAGAPVVAIAVRYDTPFGPRVFSGAYDVSLTPLSAYMSNLLAVPGASADLVDAGGTIVASSRQRGSAKVELRTVAPLLARAVSRANTGEYEDEAGRKLFVVRAVRGTPWRLVASVQEEALYAPIAGSRRRVYWWLFGALCTAMLVAAGLVVWLIESRRELRVVNANLVRLARLDRLTDLPNRLYLEEQLMRAMSVSGRSSQPLSVFIVDVDHFKAVNDSYGHPVGDEVLRTLAARMAGALRAQDTFGRWGGEEFIALLPNTSTDGAAVVADRVRVAASCAPIIIAQGQTLRMTVSVGCATTTTAHDQHLLQRADAALYWAKAHGRDRVSINSPAPHEPLLPVG